MKEKEMEICYAPYVVAGFRPGHYIYTRRSANQCAPPPAKNGGRGGSGGARSGRPFGRLMQAPPYLSCPQHDRARGAAAAECGRRSQPPPTLNNGMAGACRRARLPPTATRGTAREGTGGGAAEPRRGRAGFCAQPPPPAALAGAAGAVKAQSRRMHGAPLRSRRDGLRAYREVLTR